MAEQKFNQPYYKIKFADLDEDVAGVVSFEGEEEISGLFEYKIILASMDPKIDSTKVLNKTATFTLIRPDQSTREIHGIISRFEQFGQSKAHVFYQVFLVPRLWLLNLVFQNEVYQNMDIKDVLKKVLSDSELSGGDYKTNLKNSYPKNEYIVQYRETNLNFLNRRLEHYGIFYYFDHSGDKDVVCFIDENSSIPDINTTDKILYNENLDPAGITESIFEISSYEKVVTGTVQLKDYNYLFPEKKLMAQSKIKSDDPGIYYDYGDNFLNEKEADFLAKIRNQEILCQSKIFKGRTDSRLFTAGHRFKFDKHYRDDWNTEYIITKVSLSGNQRGQYVIPQKIQTPKNLFECNFEAIPFDIDYRPLRRTPIPKITGIMSAKIESGSGDEYAFIDDHGRYKAKMLFDISDKSNGEATLPIRLSQAYSGSGYGIHFPNHAGTELLWSCVDGNVDRPIGLGTIPNPSNASPSTGGNKSQSVIRTAGQNELTFDDKTGSENIYIHGTKDWTIDITNNKGQTIGNDETASVGHDRKRDVGNDETISIGNNLSENVGKNSTLSIGENSSVSVGKNEDVTIGENSSVSVGKNENVSIGENSSISVGKNLSESVGKEMNLSVGKSCSESIGENKSQSVGKNKSVDVGENLSENIGKNFNLQAGENITNNAGKDYSSQSGKKMTFSAGDDFGIMGGKKGVIEISNELTIKCGSASITMKKNGDITIKGKKINVKGSGDVVVKGQKILEN